jgi:serine protease AprX
MVGLGSGIAEQDRMRISSSDLRRKATWGSRIALCVLFIASLNATALAGQKASPKGPKGRPDPHSTKMDPLIAQLTDSDGRSDVIVEFHDDTNGLEIVRSFGAPGRKLRVLKAVTGRIPNGLLKQLSNHPNVRRISLDRDVHGHNGRTAVTVGARAVNELMGYRGAGIGIAVIDSGITPWHDDLTVANRQGQRVVHFKDFINGRTTPYDDWGHGTHVAGIIAGNGYDSFGSRQGIAPEASIIALKALDSSGAGRISHIIEAIDYAIAVKDTYNIRVINLSLGAGVFESYNTDPLTVAAKRAVEAGIVVVASAGNMGRNADGRSQYGGIGAPGNAPWVLTVGASSTEGSIDRRDDTLAPYSSRGPTRIDFAVKPDLVAPGTGTVSLSTPNSRMYLEKASYLVKGGLFGLTSMPYLTLSGTSMATPVVAGSVALMLQANPSLTPNLVKGILQFTAQVYPGYDWFSQGAGFLNTRGAVTLSDFFHSGTPGKPYPRMRGWSQHIFWGNFRVSGGVLTPGGTAWDDNVVWGNARTPSGTPIVWGENCDAFGSCDNDNIVWGNNIVWGDSADDDNVVWGNADDDNVVWGNYVDDNIVWGNGDVDNVVWGNSDNDNVVWGNDCEGADCDNVVWGNSSEEDNVVWGNAEGIDNIVWGNSGDDNVVWGNSDGADASVFPDDEAEVTSFDASLWDLLFEIAVPDVDQGGVQ